MISIGQLNADLAAAAETAASLPGLITTALAAGGGSADFTAQDTQVKAIQASLAQAVAVLSGGSSSGNATGTFSFAGTAGSGQIVTVNLTNAGTAIAPITYDVKGTDAPSDAAAGTAAAIVAAAPAFVQPAQAVGSDVKLTASAAGAPGAQVTFAVSVSGSGITVSPTGPTALAAPASVAASA